MRLVTVAHGTRTPEGNRVAADLTTAAGTRLGVVAEVSYVELCAPLLTDVMARTGAPPPWTPAGGSAPRPPEDRHRTVVVPLLLSTGYHLRHDLPAAVSLAGDAMLGGPLGPDPLLAAAQVRRLVDAGAEAGQPVVMMAAGSADPAALDDLHGAARLLGELWGAPVRLSTLGGIGRRPAEVVRPGDAVSPYLLAPGHFAHRGRRTALDAGATVVADVLGPHPLVVDLLCQRASRLLSVGARVPA